MADGTYTLSPRERDELRAHITGRGERATSTLLGLPRHTVVRLVAGLPCRAGTVVLARARLPRLTAEAA